MADISGFDARTIEPMKEREPVPGGKYVATIVASEMKPTRAGDGAYLELVFEIAEGQFKGHKIWSRLNLDNRSEIARKLAMS